MKPRKYSTTGPQVAPHIVVVYRDAMPVIQCGRRQAAIQQRNED